MSEHHYNENPDVDYHGMLRHGDYGTLSTPTHSHHHDLEGLSLDLPPNMTGSSQLATPIDSKSGSSTPRSRAAHTPAKKGRPRSAAPSQLSTPEVPSGTAYVNLGRQFPGITMIYRCPFAHCTRFYATKLALRRHMQMYMHAQTCDTIQWVTNPELSPEERKRVSIKTMMRLYKCPVIDCIATFTDPFALCRHFSENHHHISDPARNSMRSKQAVVVHDLMEWTEMYHDSIEISAHATIDLANIVPDMFGTREDKGYWRLLSIFDICGPHPSMKRLKLVSHLRELLLSTYNPANTSTLIIGETALRAMIMVALIELMPLGYLITRDYQPTPSAQVDQDGILDPWNDMQFLWDMNRDSVVNMLKYGSVHSSRNFVKKTKLRKSIGSFDPEQLPAEVDLSNDRFVCQVPGCAKVFASLPAYKYHMHHFEHDLEALLMSSTLIRSVLFPYLNEDGSVYVPEDHPDAHGILGRNGANWYSYDRLVLKFVAESSPSSIHTQEEEMGHFADLVDAEGNPLPPQARRMMQPRASPPILNLVYSVNDVVHILHGYIDQQLPVVWSWLLMRKREEVPINPVTNEFSLVFRKSDNVSMIKSQLAVSVVSPSVTRKRKPRKETSMGGHASHTKTLDHEHLTSQLEESLGNVQLSYLKPDQVSAYQQHKVLLQLASNTAAMSSSSLPGTGEHSMSWIEYSSVVSDEPLLTSEAFAAALSAPSNTVIVTKDEVKSEHSISAFSASVLGNKDGLCMTDGSSVLSLDWFPHAVPLSTENQYLLSLITAGSTSDQSGLYGQASEDASVRNKPDLALWSVVVQFHPDTQTYSIVDMKLNKLLRINVYGDNEYVDPNQQSTTQVLSLKWYPFALQAEGNDLDVKGILGVLYTNGEMDIFVLPRHDMFPVNVTTDHFEPALVHIREICRVAVPMYSISCFCWNKQQTISHDEPHQASMTTQLLIGTKEGSIGICDLTMPTVPQMIMLIPAHQSLISSIDWSPLNPLAVVAASFDGTVHLWNLADMYHSTHLASSKGPFLNAQWMTKVSKPFDTRADMLQPFAPVDGSGFDPSRFVLVMDDSFAKMVPLDDPNAAITLPSSHPRMWASIYPNGRHQGVLLALADWQGHLEIIGFKDPKQIHGQEIIGEWTYQKSARSFELLSGKFTQHDTPPNNDSCVGMTCIAWHSLPIPIFATASSSGLIHVRAFGTKVKQESQ